MADYIGIYATRTPRTQFKAWITKYALTKGIYEMEVEDCFDISPRTVTSVEKYPDGEMYLNGEWHRTREEAIHAANGMRARKLVSLHKQFQKLEAMEF